MKHLINAILRTVISGIIYILMPLFANWYDQFLGKYYGYAAFGSGILILFTIAMIIYSWALVFDKGLRDSYNKNINK